MSEESAIPSAAPTLGPRRPTGPRRRWRWGLIALLCVWAVTGWYYAVRPLPAGIRTAGSWTELPSGDLLFLRDLTAADAYGRPIVEQQIFERALTIIHQARAFIVLDYFLFNDRNGGAAAAPLRPLSAEIEAALLQRRREVPGLEVLFITDPINDGYGEYPSPSLERLRQAGVTVVRTDLDRLPDPDPLYSGLWRLFVRWWDALLPGTEASGLRATARLLNFKANHRKVLIADDGGERLVGLVGSANPHDASSADSNVALSLSGPVLQPLLDSEVAIARASGLRVAFPPVARTGTVVSERDFLAGRASRAQILTESAIGGALLERLAESTRGDSVDVAMLYLSDREIVEALIAAAARGVIVHVLLDPNKDEFGEERSGFPNRQVASELVAASDGAIKVRWYRTHGEQFHTKLVAICGPERVWFTLGSANLTRRNLGDFDLEANVAVEISRNAKPGADVLNWFDTLWSNRAAAGTEYTAPYEVYADPSQGRYWLYRFVEGLGVSNF